MLGLVPLFFWQENFGSKGQKSPIAVHLPLSWFLNGVLLSSFCFEGYLEKDSHDNQLNSWYDFELYGPLKQVYTSLFEADNRGYIHTRWFLFSSYIVFALSKNQVIWQFYSLLVQLKSLKKLFDRDNNLKVVYFLIIQEIFLTRPSPKVEPLDTMCHSDCECYLSRQFVIDPKHGKVT